VLKKRKILELIKIPDVLKKWKILELIKIPDVLKKWMSSSIFYFIGWLLHIFYTEIAALVRLQFI
jgi:hypothetical protein